MSDEIDKKAVFGYIKANYPNLIGNEKLMIAMYRKKVLNEKINVNGGIMSYPLRKVKDYQENEAVTSIIEKVEEKKLTEIELCGVCHKGLRKCEDRIKHKEIQTDIMYSYLFYGGDSTGEGTFKIFTGDKSKVEMFKDNDTFLVQGMFKSNVKYGNEFSIQWAKALSLDEVRAWGKVEDYMEVHGGAGGVQEDKLKEFMKDKEEELKPFLERILMRSNDGVISW